MSSRMSEGFTSISMSSSTTGIDPDADENEVWRRAAESKGEIRTNRWTPDSDLSQP